MLNPDKTFKSVDALKQLFKEKGINDPVSEEIICSCHKGFTACTVFAALKLLGNEKASVYDGSWFEYSSKT